MQSHPIQFIRVVDLGPKAGAINLWAPKVEATRAGRAHNPSPTPPILCPCRTSHAARPPRSPPRSPTQAAAAAPGPLPEPLVVASAYFESGGRQPTPAYGLSALAAGHVVPGPAILIDQISTIVVEPGWDAFVTAEGNVRLDRAAAVDGLGEDGAAAEDGQAAVADVECDPIQLAIFSHRWAAGAQCLVRPRRARPNLTKMPCAPWILVCASALCLECGPRNLPLRPAVFGPQTTFGVTRLRSGPAPHPRLY
jgi:hypothetical protein